MYYPESAIIASKNSHLADVIQKVDGFLFERHGKPFYAGTAADALRIRFNDIQGILSLYKNVGVLTERKVWLCPKHREEIAPVRDDLFHCPTCGRDYRADQCEHAVLYIARHIEMEGRRSVPDADPESSGDLIAQTPQQKGTLLRALSHLNEPWAIIIAAFIGFIGVIAAALISSNANSNTLITESSPIVIYTEMATLAPTITKVSSETVASNPPGATSTTSFAATETSIPVTTSVEVTPFAATRCFAYVDTNDNIPIYNAPDAQAQLVGRLTEGQTEVFYSSFDEQWLQIDYDTGEYGGNAWIEMQSGIQLIGSCEDIPIFEQ